jgi:site-specific DNA recombinase
MTSNEASAYLRLSDLRTEDAFTGRLEKLRTLAATRGWVIPDDGIIIENDAVKVGDTLKMKPASAWKRVKHVTPSGLVELLTIRPGFETMLGQIQGGRNLVCEDLDRIARQPRDMIRLIESIEISGSSAVSLSGSLTLTNGGTHPERMQANMLVTMAEKSSADTSRRVSWGRERWAGKSYQGGRRPFGYRVDPNGTEHQRNLIIDEIEAGVIRYAADQIVNKGISLKAVAREVRGQGIKTVTGNTFDAERLRETLIKPTIAGLQKYKTELHDAPWQPILDRETWETLVRILTDKSRRTNTSKANEPTWLLSLFATCGECGSEVRCTGTARNRYYVCKEDETHPTRKRADAADEFISALVIARLSQPDAVTLLKPPARKDIDTKALHAESRKLEDKRKRTLAMFTNDDLDESDVTEILKGIKNRQARIDAQLAASESAPDPLAEFRGNPAQAVWDGLSVARRRAVVRLLLEVRFLPAPRRSPFDPDTLEVTRRH